MVSGSRFTFADMQNPLFLHPSDGPLSIAVTKLQGSSDYRTWKISMEIQLAAKRKLGFVTGKEARSLTDITDGVQWDTCNNLVISWLHNNVFDNIRKYILFLNSACEIWRQLERRFQLTNGSRKYKLSRDLYELKQNSMSLVEYFTTLSAIWEEIDAMNTLLVVSTITPEITELLKAIETQKDESKLFQFLNGLDDKYGPQRSQILMLSPLPNVESVCAVIQQEESQQDVLKLMSASDLNIAAMYGKQIGNSKQNEKFVSCEACGGSGHVKERCWSVIGYPKWHHKSRKTLAAPKNQRTDKRWQNNRVYANAVQTNDEGSGSTEKFMFTQQQLQ
ncbi:uncharacterized protein LOC141711242 [Apium graveolens]|uniref:uncharacterized protein LOC141711242 n=1 Tax=Apium graveolens TaxID=4045 RepID=UPI003D7AD7A9